MKQYLIILCTSLAVLTANLDSTIITVSIPRIMKDLNLNSSMVSYLILAFLLGLISFLLAFGKLGDLKGERIIFSSGFFAFSLCGIASFFATSFELLIFIRFLQGSASAAIFATNKVIILKFVEPNLRNKAYGVLTVFAGAGAAIGPIIGGIILENLTWHWGFLVNVPLGFIASVIAYRLITNKPKTSSKLKAPFDYLGATYSSLSVVFVIFALNQGQELGWLSGLILGSFSVGLLFILLFVKRERNCTFPLIDFRSVFSFGSFSKMHNLGAITFMFIGLSFLFPFYFQIVLKYTPKENGFIMGIYSIAMVASSFLAGFLADKFSTLQLMKVSGLLMLLPVSSFAAFDEATSKSFIVSSFTLFGLTLGIFFTSVSIEIVNRAEKGKEGMTSSLNAVISFIYTALGVVVFETIYSFSFRNNISDSHNSALALDGFNHAAVLAIIITAIVIVDIFLTGKRKEE